MSDDPAFRDQVDAGQRTPLMHAVVNGRRQLAELLLAKGADPNLRDRYGLTALHFAAIHYAPDFVTLLVSRGANVDSLDGQGNTPLFRAVFHSNGRGEVIARLLAAGADKTRKNHHGVSPIELAHRISNYPVAQFLEDNG